MAIIPVKRIDIIGHGSLKSEILNYLQDNGSVQIITDPEDSESLEYGEESLESMISAEMQNVKYIEDAVTLLNGYAPKKSMIDKLRNEADSIKAEVIERISDDEDNRKLIEKALNLKVRLSEIKTEVLRLEQREQNLLPWASMKLRLSSLTSLTSSRILTGTVPADEVGSFSKGLADASSLAGVQAVAEENGSAYICCVYHTDVEIEVLAFLADSLFEEIKLPYEEKTALDIVEESRAQITTLSEEAGGLEKELKDLSGELTGIKARFDTENQRYERLVTRRFLGNTETVFKIRGWIPAEQGSRVRDALEKLGPVKVELLDPVKEDGAPPVILANRSLFKPFELVTQLYGMPAYGKIDPTAYLMPFFFIFFGLCLSDAGYGIMLAGAMAAFMWWIGLKGKVYSLFFWGGIATIFGGAVTGSWFGVNVTELARNNPEHWASFLAEFVLFDPLGATPESFAGLQLKGTMAFFYLSVFLGYVQICFGTGLSTVAKILRKETVSGIFDDGAWLVVYIGLALLVVSLDNVVGMPSYDITALKMPGLIMILAGLGVRLLLYPIFHVLYESEKKSAGAVAASVGISLVIILDKTKNLLGNVLSYCRLMALGMATGIIGSIVNMLAGKVESAISEHIPLVGILVMVVMVSAGHVINLLINLLGSFVHTARLQYVEFFPYFFDGGGEQFKPFEKKFRFVKVEK